MDNRILSETLMGLGISPNAKGYHCLRLAVTLSLGEAAPPKLTTQLYPRVGEELGMTVSSVDRAIRHAIKSGWSRRDRRFAQTVFSFILHSLDDVPSPSLFIAALREYISNQF